MRFLVLRNDEAEIMNEMHYCDAHTHLTPNAEERVRRIYHVMRPTEAIPETLFSIGIHPKDALMYSLEDFRGYFNSSNLRAIGECGLDRTASNVPLNKQNEVFREHVRMSEENGKPLILHCVRCAQEMIHLKKELKPLQPWIFHGFRGNRRKAFELVEAGFILSFGTGLLKDSGNPEAFFAEIPPEQILLETDAEPAETLPMIYATAAQLHELNPICFADVIEQNFNRIFGNE